MATLPGLLLCGLLRQALKRPRWLGPFSVACHIRHLKGCPGSGHFLLVNVSGA